MTGVCQGSIEGPVFFNIFINNIDSGTGWTLNEFVDDTKLRIEESASIQRDLGRLRMVPSGTQELQQGQDWKRNDFDQPCREGIRNYGGRKIGHEPAMCS